MCVRPTPGTPFFIRKERKTMGKGKVSKNNVTGSSLKRYVEDDVVVPTMYDGHNSGNGKYMTGMVNNQLVEDSNGKPLPLKEIGVLR